MSDEAQRMARAEQADTALKQFLAPAFDLHRAAYVDKLADIAARPLTNDLRAGIEKLALGIKVLDQVRADIEALVADGQVAAHEAKAASNITKLNPEARRWAQF